MVSQRLISCLFRLSKRLMSSSCSIEELKNLVKDQGDFVKRLKDSNANKDDINNAVRELKIRKKKLEDLSSSSEVKKYSVNRTKVEDLLKRRFFIAPSFEIYGGVAGLYDFGPMGCATETNIINLWRRYFVIEDQMLEVRCTQLTPYNVLEASGHTEKFADYMVKDTVTGDCYRADHLIKNFIEKKLTDTKTCQEVKIDLAIHLRQLDNYSGDELDKIIEKYELKSTALNNPLSKVAQFNLMFPTSIGPTGTMRGFLRPETAQGIFLNFKRLLEFNTGQLPFAAAQIGCGFRNEISPRSGLIRVREFLMAEIEHFVDPEDKTHPRIDLVHDEVLSFFPVDLQLNGDSPIEISVKSALEKGIVKNSLIGYYLGKIQRFLLAIGISRDKLRFREHLPNEMAHYACSCWDGEILTSYGWIECLGCADRGCYDLKQHSNKSKEKLIAQKKLETPIQREVTRMVPNRSEIGKKLKKDSKTVIEALEGLLPKEVDSFAGIMDQRGEFDLTLNGTVFTITKDMIAKVERMTEEVFVTDIEPHVIEPSFGVGRIMYSLFEHAYRVRPEDEARAWLAFPASIAPIKCAILPLSKRKEFDEILKSLSAECATYGLSCRVDDSSGSIGRRYARSDEIGIPYAITVDFESVKGTVATVTMRERNSTQQIRMGKDETVKVLHQLVIGTITWDDCVSKHGLFEGQKS